MKNSKSLILALIFIFLDPAHLVAASDKFAGMVCADRVNVRAGPSTNFEPLFQLEKSAIVKVLGENSDWYRIVLPEEASCFISAKYLEKIDNNYFRITGKNVNVRGGPSTNYNVLCQVNTGDTIFVREIKDDWAKIYPPQDSAGWIHKDYVKYYTTLARYAIEEQKEQETVQLFAAAEEEYCKMQKKTMLDADFSSLLIKYKQILDKYNPTAEQSRLIQQRIDELCNKAKEIALLKNDLYTRHTPLAVGKIQDLGWYIKRPGTHKLIDHNKNTLYYLKGDRKLLNQYANEYVKIWGTLEQERRYKHSIIIVEKIEPM
ncbi:MAG: SH3 domain-containing protein [Candidatus Omnitrophota bacterium]